MNIALVHYHLRPGGVTAVMLNQAQALRENGDTALLVSGEAPPAAAAGRESPAVTVIPELHYDRCRADAAGAEELAAALSEALRPFRPDLVIVHNPLIRKNSALLGALKALIRRGFPLLLQNHDLAEDFRPDVYPNEDYPENCHYAVINSRDYAFLLEAGLKREGLHLVPNEVRPMTAAPGLERTRYLYPVRGIRRKNLGEAILLSLFAGEGRTVAVTQPPTTGRDSGVYLRWKEFARELRLPVEFEAGVARGFPEVLGSAFAVITTSIKEGFGFSFLEPWTAGLAVTGRRIPYVCRDFENAGVSFAGFYDTIALPSCAATKDYPDRFRAKLEQAFAGLNAAFGAESPAAFPPAAAGGGDAMPDFGAMDEEMQEDFIRKAAADSALRNAAAELNPFLKNFADWRPDPALVESNRAAVLASYSRERIAGILRESCRAAASPVVQSLSRRKLLRRFLDPSRFFLTGISANEQQ